MKFFSQWTLIVKGVGLYLQSCGVFLNCKCGLDFSSLEIRYSLVLIMFWSCFLQTIRIFSRRESKTTVWQEINKWKNLWVESQVQQCSSTAKMKLERLHFSTSSSFFNIWSACSCEFKVYFWTFWLYTTCFLI